MTYCRVYDKVIKILRARRMIRLLPERYDLNRPLEGRQFPVMTQHSRPPRFVVSICLVWFPCHWRKDFCTTWTWYNKGAEVYFFPVRFAYLMNLGKPQCGQWTKEWSTQRFYTHCRRRTIIFCKTIPFAAKIASNHFSWTATAIAWMALDDKVQNFPSAPSSNRGRPPKRWDQAFTSFSCNFFEGNRKSVTNGKMQSELM